MTWLLFFYKVQFLTSFKVKAGIVWDGFVCLGAAILYF